MWIFLFFFFLGVGCDVARRYDRAAARLARNRRTHGFCNCGQMALKEKEGANPTEPSKPERGQLVVFLRIIYLWSDKRKIWQVWFEVGRVGARPVANRPAVAALRVFFCARLSTRSTKKRRRQGWPLEETGQI